MKEQPFDVQPSQLSINLAIITLTSFVMFVILKVGDVIDWSWWWITSPLWIAVIINIFAVIGMYLSLFMLKRSLKNLARLVQEEKLKHTYYGKNQTDENQEIKTGQESRQDSSKTQEAS